MIKVNIISKSALFRTQHFPLLKFVFLLCREERVAILRLNLKIYRPSIGFSGKTLESAPCFKLFSGTLIINFLKCFPLELFSSDSKANHDRPRFPYLIFNHKLIVRFLLLVSCVFISFFRFFFLRQADSFASLSPEKVSFI